MSIGSSDIALICTTNRKVKESDWYIERIGGYSLGHQLFDGIFKDLAYYHQIRDTHAQIMAEHAVDDARECAHDAQKAIYDSFADRLGRVVETSLLSQDANRYKKTTVTLINAQTDCVSTFFTEDQGASAGVGVARVNVRKEAAGLYIGIYYRDSIRHREQQALLRVHSDVTAAVDPQEVANAIANNVSSLVYTTDHQSALMDCCQEVFAGISRDVHYKVLQERLTEKLIPAVTSLVDQSVKIVEQRTYRIACQQIDYQMRTALGGVTSTTQIGMVAAAIVPGALPAVVAAAGLLNWMSLSGDINKEWHRLSEQQLKAEPLYDLLVDSVTESVLKATSELTTVESRSIEPAVRIAIAQAAYAGLEKLQARPDAEPLQGRTPGKQHID